MQGPEGEGISGAMTILFVLGSYDSSAKVGDPVRYEELITFTTLPGRGGQVGGVRLAMQLFLPSVVILKLVLESDRTTLMEHSKYTREQELKLTDKLSYRAAW